VEVRVLSPTPKTPSWQLGGFCISSSAQALPCYGSLTQYPRMRHRVLSRGRSKPDQRLPLLFWNTTTAMATTSRRTTTGPIQVFLDGGRRAIPQCMSGAPLGIGVPEDRGDRIVRPRFTLSDAGRGFSGGRVGLACAVGTGA
jgi:hypothetical protein